MASVYFLTFLRALSSMEFKDFKYRFFHCTFLHIPVPYDNVSLKKIWDSVFKFEIHKTTVSP